MTTYGTNRGLSNSGATNRGLSSGRDTAHARTAAPRGPRRAGWLALALSLVLGGAAGVSVEQARGQVPQAVSALARSATAQAAPSRGQQTVTIVVRGLRSSRGQVIGALFDEPSRWVREGQETATCAARIQGRLARCVMRVPAGHYAFAFGHDENGSGAIDRDFLGIPQEGYGFSNDVRPSLSLPSWRSAAFLVPPGRAAELQVTTRYGL